VPPLSEHVVLQAHGLITKIIKTLEEGSQEKTLEICW